MTNIVLVSDKLTPITRVNKVVKMFVTLYKSLDLSAIIQYNMAL